MLRHFLGIVMGGVFALIFYVVFFVDIDLTQWAPKEDDVPDFKFENVIISHVNNGVVEMELNASSATIYRDSNKVHLKTAKGVFYFGAGDFFLLDSPSADYDMLTQAMQLEDASMAYLNQGTPLWVYSKWLQWNPEGQEIISETDSDLYFRDMKIKTRYLKLDLAENKMYLDDRPEMLMEVLQ
jgi:hypothetical protein